MNVQNAENNNGNNMDRRNEAIMEAFNRLGQQIAAQNNQEPAPQPVPQRQPPNANNQFTTVRDRLFHAMLVRVALQYNSRFNIKARIVIEFVALLTALLLLASLLFVHLNFARSTTSCLDQIKPEWFKDGVVRVEVIKNLKMLERQEEYIQWYIREKSQRVCTFNVKDVFLHGPRAMPAEVRAKAPLRTPMTSKDYQKPPLPFHHGLISYFIRAPMEIYPITNDEDEDDEAERATSDSSFSDADPLEIEANVAYRDLYRQKYTEEDDYDYVYRVEYAFLYGVLRLPPSFRDKHGIPTSWIRVDADSECFGDSLTRSLMRTFLGYEDAVINTLRAHALNASMNANGQSMGYLHDLHTHEHYHFVSSTMGKTSYITAAFLMLTFTFAISMLLRFSHHQIFVFIVDLLHMFELQQPLYFPVAPIFTVILALVASGSGMEAIMSEVFNDTTTAFYVILIVWIADQYDAICCHSPISKRFWLRFFYMYQFFFYAYQYRFGGQYGGLALVTSSAFILHSMIFFFHHYEMPLILYQERVQQVLSEMHAAPQMGTVEVQTVSVTEHINVAQPQRPVEQIIVGMGNENVQDEPAEQNVEDSADNPTDHIPEPLSPSSVFDARGPALLSPAVEQRQGLPSLPDPDPSNPEERVAHAIVSEVVDELFNS